MAISTPFVSIVTITFNNYDELVATLKSIEAVKGVESVVINGGSCDKTKTFLKTYKETTGATVISEPDRGISDAFNKGVIHSKGIGVMFLNSGDLLLAKSYPFEAAELLERDARVAFTYGDILFEDSLCGDIIIGPKECVLGRGTPYPHQSMITRKSVFDQVGLFKLEYKAAMDFEHLCRMYKANFKGFYWKKTPITKMDGQGVSTKQEIKTIQESVRALRHHRLMTPENLRGLAIRVSLYQSRMWMHKFKLDPLLRQLKLIKYPRKYRAERT